MKSPIKKYTLHLLPALLVILITIPVAAQQLTGKVTDAANPGQPIIGASVAWKGTTHATTTNATGDFTLTFSDSIISEIIVNYVGYTSQTINVTGKQSVIVSLSPNSTLKEVVIEGQQERFSSISPTNSQIITNRDLEKSACCNLAESFETSASVEVSTTDAVSGAKQIQMLGLDGAYTLLTTDNVPALQGLATPYRLNYLSGTFIESIDIIKGMGSVLNGYESISGQVNVKLKDPEKTERLYLNLYGNTQGKFDANVNVGVQVNKVWSTALMLHTAQLHHRSDRNNDGFMDLPLNSQYNVYNKWKYNNGNFISEFGVNALREDRIGGQMDFEKGSEVYYGTTSETERVSAYNKTSYTFDGKPYQSIGLISSASNHVFDSKYGNRIYDGNQQNSNVRLIFQSIIGHTGHTYKTGLSYTYDNTEEKLDLTRFKRTEHVPGAFAEYIFNNSNNLTIVAGSRVDFHNLYGTVFSPRLNVKFDATRNTIFRIAAGKGFRVANPIAENTASLVSSRAFVFENNLKPEEAWNIGGSFTQYFELAGRPGAFITDYYYTNFTNQVVADMYTTHGQVRFSNLDGKSFAKSFQAELQYEVLKGFDVKAAYKYYDVKATYNGELRQKPMVPEHRFFVNLGFATPFDKWRADLTTQYFGVMPLAYSEKQNGAEMPRASEQFVVLNGQVSRAFKRWELYTGVENLLNYRQPSPIVGASDPFGPDFDASMVWGPIAGRVVYAGLRFKIN
ncbi:carboxypeptidase-like regulatory domain-containing protein [Pontibacter sp. KCTC 32443]|uniref:TonB-dependent receptor plug domain-containing protein n=1 Tax=Pontibacter TaxID=323449 RepID=UPI00164E9038|nr:MULTISPECIES: TonB-dependent receptor [Pontibacter]MBC5775016.1 carboxypeptidase-like regulatory domain-containing protein [Pontibacter sp. KCTC 32443]